MKFLYLLFTLLLLNGCCLQGVPVDSYVTGTVSHATCDQPSSASIVQQWNSCFNILPISNQNYTWSNGKTTKDVSDLSPNYPAEYKCDIDYTFLNMPWHISKKYGVRYDTEWPLSTLIDYNTSNKTLHRNSIDPSNFGTVCSKNILPENGIGCIDFECLISLDMTATTIFIGFDNLNCPTTVSTPNSSFTGFELIKFGNFGIWTLFRNGVRLEYYDNTNALRTVSGIFASGDKFTVKYGNGVQYYHQGSIIPIPLMLTSSPIITHPAYKVRCSMKGAGLTLKDVLSSFACSNGTDYYAELKKELDGSCYTMTGAINFVYKEKYNDNSLSYVVYDWQRNPVLTSLILPVATPNSIGTNYHSIKANGLLADEFYTLEVTNSKGEVYKMRFRYVSMSSTTDMFTLTPRVPGSVTVKPTYVGPVNIDPTIKVSVNTPKGISSVIDLQNSLDYE